MIFSLDVRRARKGDCLLLHYGPEDDLRLAIIDGGPATVYKKHLKPRLDEIRKGRKLKLKDNQSLRVDLLMVSHVDDDHIRGILDLTRELSETPSAPSVRVLNFWHNSFDDIIGNTPDATAAAVFGAASLDGSLPDGMDLDSDEDPEVVTGTLMVLASIAQGHRLRDDIRKLEARVNLEFDGKLIVAGKKAREIGAGLSFTVAGPMTPEIEALQKKHEKWLQEQKNKKPEAALAAYVDKSVPNLSSIVVLAEAGGKTILLTGDARGDKILEGLEQTGVLKSGGTIHVDILKVPHHGSANNLETGFFERVLADHYVFSGDGQHGNPERESFEMLFHARGKAPLTIHLTYPQDEIDREREKEWNAQRARELDKGKTPRDEWSPARHSLDGFFKKHPLASGQKIEIADAKKPHVINLLDPLGF